ncbi:MAG TPA: hypothetical protein VEI26_16160 [Terriglobales bacterium]|nr:hypothetical protein [Terriglobales bacterium]
MRRINRNPVYNARNPAMHISVGITRASCLLWMLLQAGIALAADWQIPAGQLAQRITGITGPGTVAVTVVSRSSLSESDVQDIRRKLVTELAAYGVQSAAFDQAAASVQVTLSENLGSYLWVAEIRQGTSEPVVVMISMPGEIGGAAEGSSIPLSIRQTLLLSAETPILDATIIDGNPSYLVVLQPEKIGLYRMQNGSWQLEQSFAVVHVRPWPRDLRGRLIVRKDHLFDAYLPGVYCRSGVAAPLNLTCDDSDDPWPLTGNPGDPRAFFSGARNFFTGALSPGVQKQTNAPAFYSAAPLPRDKYTLWVFAGVDGRIHFLDGVSNQVLPQSTWGSGVASVRSGCGMGWQILADSNEDGPTDEVRAFEILDREPVAVSAPSEFHGPLTALWSDSYSTAITAVSHNSETGRYEAYRLSIDCHR